jgi:hypothetical protein
MRLPHIGTVLFTVSNGCKSAHRGSCLDWTRTRPMFVRAVWRSKRLVTIKQTPREMEVPTIRDALGISGGDFQKMTRGLFDR